MTEQHNSQDVAERRPLGLNLLTGIYFFWLLLNFSTVGNPFPFMGHLYVGRIANIIIFIDTLICLYLVIGIYKRQYLTWYLLLFYNSYLIVDTVVNLKFITPEQIEKIIGKPVDINGLINNNIILALGILLLTQFIYRHKGDQNRTAMARKILELAMEQGRANLAEAKTA